MKATQRWGHVRRKGLFHTKLEGVKFLEKGHYPQAMESSTKYYTDLGEPGKRLRMSQNGQVHYFSVSFFLLSLCVSAVSGTVSLTQS